MDDLNLPISNIWDRGEDCDLDTSSKYSSQTEICCVFWQGTGYYWPPTTFRLFKWLCQHPSYLTFMSICVQEVCIGALFTLCLWSPFLYHRWNTNIRATCATKPFKLMGTNQSYSKFCFVSTGPVLMTSYLSHPSVKASSRESNFSTSWPGLKTLGTFWQCCQSRIVRSQQGYVPYFNISINK